VPTSVNHGIATEGTRAMCAIFKGTLAIFKGTLAINRYVVNPRFTDEGDLLRKRWLSTCGSPS
jgi:hypothetical protein